MSTRKKLHLSACLGLLVLAGGTLVGCGGGGSSVASVTATPPPLTLTVPQSGVTASQCYAAGNSTLGACANNALNAQQDGNRNVGSNVMSYAQVLKPDGVTYYDKTYCVKDTVTGLIWEGKMPSGMRAGSNTYTNYDNNDNGGSDSNITASTNSVDYVSYVNGQKICGFSDWRLPTLDELLTLVDYSKGDPGPSINTTWFPNTNPDYYWSSTVYVDSPKGAWDISFTDGTSISDFRTGLDAIRLVRSGP
jgi:hypothetical protein